MGNEVLIRNARLYTHLERPGEQDLLVADGRIARLGTGGGLAAPPGARILPAAGLVLAPGLIDLQLNGAFGHDFTGEPDSIWTAAAQLPRYGVTAFLPTIITAPLEAIAAAQAVLQSGPPPGFHGAQPLGLHREGPFLNPEKKGAHPERYLRPPDPEDYRDLRPVKGVRLVTLAPELPGAEDVVRALVGRGVLVSAGHSQASFQEAQAAFSWGIRYATHLFNAMRTFHHHEPGLVGAALTDPHLTCGLIVDGIHLHPAVVQTIYRTVGINRISLVTDAIAALGMPPGRYTIGAQPIVVTEDSARLEDGVLAGSILSLDTAARNFQRITGCTQEQALGTVTTTPARLLGEADRRGRLAPGLRADLVLLTPEMDVAATICGGNLAYVNPELIEV